MNANTTTSTILLDNLIIQLNRYLAILILLFGGIGNILNILVLSQRILRINSCAWLFCVSSFANLIAILAALITRILSTWLLDLTSTIAWICKLRAFILFESRTIAFWLITLASIDRWLVSSRDVHYRQWSTIKNAQRGLLVIICISTIVFIHLVYCYDANQNNSPLNCYGITPSCRLYSDLTFAFITVFIPLILMISFGLMTVRNIHNSRSRTEPVALLRMKQKSNRKTDRQLTKMLLVQIILLSLFTLPLIIQRLYITITMNVLKSNQQKKIDNFIYTVLFLLYAISNGMPFYIYTLTGGNIFHNVLFNLIHLLINKITFNRRYLR